MAIELNDEAFIFAEGLIKSGRVVDDLHGEWGTINPDADQQDVYIEDKGIDAFAQWHLGINPSANPETKSAYSFPFGDYKNVYRSGLIAAEERAAQYGYEQVRAAAEELLKLFPKSQ
ncbi:hypothetical protein FYJ24_08865 [Actinomycetaceae bacterium WB03_NA08]|uniref:Uncharacterized protein n=1 Tax=Scrofimicrobium canadense TaxID=2652290 RepID=A0A6N7W8W5_9ACTO|nr:hypothetical protein [Scrofimicrobium canadense]MSS84872.1 hypothetical protein [Scrofimicrobium canadense]